jgi:hypothetical protein
MYINVAPPRQRHLQRVGGPILSENANPAFVDVLKHLIDVLSSSREVGNLGANRMKLQQSGVRQRQPVWIGGGKRDGIWYVIYFAIISVKCRSLDFIVMRIFLCNVLVYTCSKGGRRLYSRLKPQGEALEH